MIITQTYKFLKELLMANRQIARSRKMMQDALLNLMHEKPFKKINMREIGERANLSRKTIYNHFENKEALLASLVDDILEPIFEGLSSSMIDPDNQDRALEDFKKFFLEWKQNYPTISIVRKASRDSLFLRRILSWFIQLYRTAIVPARHNNNDKLGEFTISLIAGNFYMALIHWSDNGMDFPPDLIGEYLFAFISPSILSNLADEFIPKFKPYY